MPSLREDAEVVRLGLLMGLVRPGDVIAWADRVIAEMDSPPIEVIDVATAVRGHAVELAGLLRGCWESVT